MCKFKVKADRDKSAGRGDVIHCSASEVFPKSVPDSTPPHIWTRALRGDRYQDPETAPLARGAFYLDSAAVSDSN